MEVAATDTTPYYYINHGNTISNNGVLTLNGALNFESVYRKAPYFRDVMKRFSKDGRKKANNEKREVVATKNNLRFAKGVGRLIYHNLGTTDVDATITDIDGQPINGSVSIVDKNRIRFTADDDYEGCTAVITGKKDVNDSPLLVATDYLAMALMSVRNISVTYKNQRSNTLTGYRPDTKVFGSNYTDGMITPGIDYLMALNDDDFHLYAADKGWLLQDSTLADPVMYTKGNSIGVRVALEPINTFRIDVNFDRSIVYNTEEFFAYATDIDGWQTSSRVKHGNFRISYNMIKTAFHKVGDDYSLDTYNKFLTNREIIAERQAERRMGLKNYDPTPQVDAGGNPLYGNYPNGYSKTHQDVLLPAFLSAYAGTSAHKIRLDPFLKMPLPNWRINYRGLGNIPLLKNVVRSAMLTHAYTSSYSITNFKNNAEYSFDDEYNWGRSFARYEANNLFIPQYEIAAVTLDEKFAPLAGIDISWVNLMSTKFEYRRTRQITLGFANSQISEMYRKEWIIGVGYKFAQLPLNIRTSGGSNRFKSDLDLRADFVIDDDKTIIREIENLYDQISAGQTSFSIKSTADYRLSERFKVQLYYNHQITNPIISTSYRTSNIKFGFSITMSLD